MPVCDRCGAQAYVDVRLDTGSSLSFCGHHYAANEEALVAYAVHVEDRRAELYATP